MDRAYRPCDNDRARMLTALAAAALVDLLLVNGRIWSSDQEVQALAIAQGRVVAANSNALQLAKVTADTPEPPGGVIVRKPGSREPSGILRDKAANLVEGRAPPPSQAEIDQAVSAALQQAARDGVTSMDDMGL